MYEFVIALMVFFAVLLVIVILAQNSKGGGLTSQFGGSSASNIIGVKQTGNILANLTWSFIVVIMALALSTNFLSSTGNQPSNEILDKASQSAPASTPTSPLPLDTTLAAPGDSASK